MDLIPKLAELAKDSPNIRSAALGVDIREGQALERFPAIYSELGRVLPTSLIFMEADTSVLVRRFSETRRPHPLGTEQSLEAAIEAERSFMEPIRALATVLIDTSRFNVHELRDIIIGKFQDDPAAQGMSIAVSSFGFRYGTPVDSSLVFDVRFLPNPNYIPEFKNLTGKHPSVARFIRSFPQTQEFIERISQMLAYLIPHYQREGKSYLSISFGCTGGQHRSVMIASEIRKRLAKEGFTVREEHRDMKKQAGRRL